MSTSLRVCSSPAASFSALTELVRWADELRLAYAWATSNDGQAAHWRTFPLAKVTQATIGIQFAQTEPAVLRTLLRCGEGILRVVNDTGGVFHPKIIVGLVGRKARALIGSSNFTHGGFQGNTEFNLLLEGSVDAAPLNEVIAFLDQQRTHPRAFEPDDDWLEKYQKAYDNRPIPKPVPKKGSAGKQILIRTVTDLDITWADYYALIRKQERRALSNGYQIHIFDHPECSYLQEIEQCQAIFAQNGRFADIPLEDRKFVAGFGGTSGYFGRMKGAGNYKNMIIERPREIGDALDNMPSVGCPSDAQVLKCIKKATAIYGVNFGTATRLLVAKRPDIFLSLNAASRTRIKEVFGSAPTNPERYLDLLKRIWSMLWFTMPAPEDEHELRIWRARVAILDAIMYDVA